MLKTTKKVLATILSAAILLATITGCSSQEQQDNKTDTDAITATPITELKFPLTEKPITLSIFMELDGKTSVTKKSYGEVEAYKKLAELTNINLEWQHPPVGQTKEQFNLMMASGDLADIVFYDWRNGYPGGPTKAIAENLILPLDDLITEYSPNLRAVFEKYPKFIKDAKTDEGHYFAFPYGNKELYPRAEKVKPAFYTFGWQIRKDWVEKLGLKMPETLDQWYETLTAFKTKDPNGNGKADEIPLIHKGNDVSQWLRAWGLDYDFSLVDGIVKYGAYEPEYKEFLTIMNRWYTEGLLDIDYVTVDGKQFDAKVSGSAAGAWTGSTSGTMGRFVQLMKEKEPTAYITGTVQPYVTGGKPYNFDAASFYRLSSMGAAISAKCKYPKEAAMMLDYAYSDAGDALYTWGIEGKSYTNENGQFKLTDEIVKNPNGLSLDQALAQYSAGANGAMFFNSESLWNQRMWMPEQQEGVANWSVGSGERIMPPVSPTVEESSKLADITNKVNTYRDEMLHKFIMGIVPLSEYDSYIKSIKDMGIEDAIAIKQEAYKRYQNR